MVEEYNYIMKNDVDGVRLIGYTDVDWAQSAVDRKSMSRCCFTMGLVFTS